MSFYSDASLVMIPSGYKTSKVYSAVPTDGTGDLTFTRSNDTATRVASNGLIEKVRTNLALQSQTFDNASWTKDASSITANTIAAPDGTLTAETLTADGTSASHGIRQTGTATLTNGIVYSTSIYAKKGTNDFIQIVGSTAPYVTFNVFANFDLNNGVVGTVGSSVTATIQDAGNGWYRCTMIAAAAATSSTNSFIVQIVSSASAARGESNSLATSVFLWGAQLETSDFGPTPYIPTVAAAVSVGPVANVPRLDYLGSTCPKLQLEPQTTALNQFSESFNNAYWIKNDVTISANTTETLDPAGYYGADKVVETATAARHRVAAGSTTISAANHTASVFMKKGTARYGFVTFSGAAVSTIVVDLENGTITSTSTSGTIVAQKVEDYGSGWYRISVTALGTATTTTYTLQFGSAGSATPSYTSNIPSFTGSTSNYLYAWGANLTATSYLQSYIPTLAASVTRGSDSCSKTGISSLIGQTEGTLFLDINVPSITSAGTYASHTLNDGTSSNQIEFTYYPTGRIQAVGIVGGSVNVNINLTSYGLTAGNHKIAFAYKLNDYVLYVDGAQAGADTSASVPATSVFNLYAGSGSTQVYNQALLFKTRLTNSELASLTTI